VEVEAGDLRRHGPRVPDDSDSSGREPTVTVRRAFPGTRASSVTVRV
jgi:hypothetical protein